MDFAGICPAMFTPLTDDGESVSVERLRRLIAFLLEQRIAGLFICGSTGEGLLLSTEERELVAEVTCAEVAGRVPVMVHVGALATRDSVRLARHAAAAGAAAVSSIPPLYFPVAPSSVLEHWRRIGDASSLPLYVYHIPRLTGHRVTPDDVGDILALPNIAGMKYSDPDIAMMRQILLASDGRLTLLSGYDQQCAWARQAGADGAIGSTYNFLAPLFVTCYEALARGDLAAANAAQHRANALMAPALGFEVIAGQKAVMACLGVDCGPTRHPIRPLSRAECEALGAALEASGLKELYP